MSESKIRYIQKYINVSTFDSGIKHVATRLRLLIAINYRAGSKEPFEIPTYNKGNKSMTPQMLQNESSFATDIYTRRDNLKNMYIN